MRGCRISARLHCTLFGVCPAVSRSTPWLQIHRPFHPEIWCRGSRIWLWEIDRATGFYWRFVLKHSPQRIDRHRHFQLGTLELREQTFLLHATGLHLASFRLSSSYSWDIQIHCFTAYLLPRYVINLGTCEPGNPIDSIRKQGYRSGVSVLSVGR